MGGVDREGTLLQPPSNMHPVCSNKNYILMYQKHCVSGICGKNFHLNLYHSFTSVNASSKLLVHVFMLSPFDLA
jgi:hypothetical protein